jgi:hypothetical protein
MNSPELLIGVVGTGVTHFDTDDFDLDTRFRMVHAAGVFDYYDRTPPPGEIDLYRATSARHAVPLYAGGYFYRLGRDEPLLEWHLRVAGELGMRAHNVQIMTADASGRPVTDDEVAGAYLRAAEIGERVGVKPCLEVHVNMWSEHFGRIERVARLVEARSVPFCLTLDASHVIFKIGNPAEQQVQDMAADLASGDLVLDPSQEGHVCGRWISAGWVAHAHARPAVPNNPRNTLAAHPDGKPGRGVQYPFTRPRAGAWHSPWDEQRLEPWKQVMRQLLDHHANGPRDASLLISTEIIPFVDYGAGARYSLFEDNVAVAVWLRQEWREATERARLKRSD